MRLETHGQAGGAPVSPSADLVEKIKVFKVEIKLDELAESFKTGMSANVEILGEKRDKAVSIPLEALQKRDGKTIAYRLKPDLKPKQLAAAKAVNNATVTAKGDTTLLVLGQREFSGVLDSIPGLAHKLLAYMAARLGEADMGSN